MDLCIANPMAKSNQRNDDHNAPLTAAQIREEEKRRKYEEACRNHNLDFRPIVFESTGAFGQSAKDFLAILLSNSCTSEADSLNPDNDFARLVHHIEAALHQAMGDKFKAAAAFRSGKYAPRGRGASSRRA